jgi:hypothetical protein
MLTLLSHPTALSHSTPLAAMSNAEWLTAEGLKNWISEKPSRR